MKKINYIFFLLILLLINNNVYANNVVANNQNLDILKELLKINNSIEINLNYYEDELVARRKVLDLIKDNNKTITYNIIYNNEIIYKYIFNGNFNKSYNDINLKIDFEDNKKLDDIFKTNKKIIIDTEYKGYYPNSTIISIKNKKSIRKGYLYEFNNNMINRIKSKVILNNNYINFNIKKGNNYIITNKELVEKNTINIYLSLIIIFIIEISIFVFIILFKNDIEIPKKRNI